MVYLAFSVFFAPRRNSGCLPLNLICLSTKISQASAERLRLRGLLCEITLMWNWWERARRWQLMMTDDDGRGANDSATIIRFNPSWFVAFTWTVTTHLIFWPWKSIHLLLFILPNKHNKTFQICFYKDADWDGIVRLKVGLEQPDIYII